MKYSIKDLKAQKKGFIFNSDKFLNTILPSGWSEKRLVSVKNNIIGETKLLTETISNMVGIGLTDKSNIKDTVKKFTTEYGSGLSDTENSKKLPHGQNMLRNRVEQTLLYDNAKMVGEMYPGRLFIWLPSGAKEPRHSHMLRYGKVYAVGSGVLPEDDDFPGKARGCKCGYQWVDEKPTEYSLYDESDVDIYKKVRQKELRRISPTINNFVKKLPSLDIINYLTQTNKTLLADKYKNSFDKNGTVINSFTNFIQNNDKINPIIIKGEKLSDKLSTIKKDVYNSFNYMRTPTNLKLYRGTVINETLEKLKPGSKVYISNPGFTSLDKDIAEGFAISNKLKNGNKKPVIFEIKLAKGARIMPSLLFSKHIKEAEVLLAPMNSFKIESITETDNLIKVIMKSIKGQSSLKRIIL